MNYAAFKTYLRDTLWRPNDTEFANNLDNIIRMAHAELNRKLTIQKREVTATIAPTAEDHALPADFYQMISLTNMQPERQSRSGDMKATTLSTIMEYRATAGSAFILPFYYVQSAAAAKTLYLIGPFSVENPGSLSLSYRTGVPDFAVEDSSWLEEEYLDLYVYTVFKHAAIFLREDERVQTYNGYMADALTSAIDDDLRNVRFGGSPLYMKPHRPVPVTRRR